MSNRERALWRISALLVFALCIWASGVIPAIIPASVPAAFKIGNGTKFQIAASGAVSGDCASFDAGLNIKGPGTGAGCGPAISGLTPNALVTALTSSTIQTPCGDITLDSSAYMTMQSCDVMFPNPGIDFIDPTGNNYSGIYSSNSGNDFNAYGTTALHLAATGPGAVFDLATTWRMADGNGATFQSFANEIFSFPSGASGGYGAVFTEIPAGMTGRAQTQQRMIAVADSTTKYFDASVLFGAINTTFGPTTSSTYSIGTEGKKNDAGVLTEYRLYAYDQVNNRGIWHIDYSFPSTFIFDTGIDVLLAAGKFTAPTIDFLNTCTSVTSPATCGASSAGASAIPTATTTFVVNTTAVTGDSEIHVTPDASLGTKLGITCNVAPTFLWISARTPGTSFTVAVAAGPAVNKLCFSYTINN